MPARTTHFYRWSSGTKLLILLTLALFPLGLALAWTARTNLEETRAALVDNSVEDGQMAAREVEGLIARNALALRIAANGALRAGSADPCLTIAQSLALTPAIASRFAIRDPNASVVCSYGGFVNGNNLALVEPGAILLWVRPDQRSVRLRVGVAGGMVTGELSADDIAQSVRDVGLDLVALSIRDDRSEVRAIEPSGNPARSREYRLPIAGGQLTAIVRTSLGEASQVEQIAVFLPLLMWVAAALLSWYLVRRLLLTPLGRLQRAVLDYQPGDDRLVLPEKLGPAEEIRSLGEAFERAVSRLESSESQMADALQGQRRLVREVHHRVKNNLQVIASLLNIHGRSATTPESAAAYAAIGRRVDALAVVHRNHFAEVEESRGIALRPLLTELGAILRASAPDPSAPADIHLDADVLHTTQDAAVAVAFFVTEVVEFAMLKGAARPIEIELSRMTELSASLTVSSDALVATPGEAANDRAQFERVVSGLARQLRSPLDEKVGRMSVNLAVFPD